MINKIVDFLDEHYSDSDLNLYKISVDVELPEKYISQLFKDHTGENLSDYLEKIRIKRLRIYCLTANIRLMKFRNMLVIIARMRSGELSNAYRAYPLVLP